MVLSPIVTRLSAKRTASRGTLNSAAANSVRRSRMLRAAICAAAPLRSVPDDAAVAEVFGTLPVLVADIRIWSRSIWNASATTCATLTNRPCPISVPP